MIIFNRFDAPKKRTCLKPDDLDSAGRRCGKRASKGKGKAEEPSQPKYKGKCLRASDLTASGKKCGKRSLEIRKPDEFKKIVGDKKPEKPAKKPAKKLDKPTKPLPITQKDAKKRYGKPIASGAFGSAYVDGDRIVKVGEIGENEVKNLAKANELGIGPTLIETGKMDDSNKRNKYGFIPVYDSSYAMGKVDGVSMFQAANGMYQKYKDAFQPALKDTISQIRRLHENGLSHGDLHQGNVMIDESGKATLIDFGMSVDRDYSDSEYKTAVYRDLHQLSLWNKNKALTNKIKKELYPDTAYGYTNAEYDAKVKEIYDLLETV